MKQTQVDRLKRIAAGRCPIHGTVLLQWEHVDTYECSRDDCAFTMRAPSASTLADAINNGGKITAGIVPGVVLRRAIVAGELVPIFDDAYGASLRRQRQRLALSVGELAEAIGIRASAVMKLEAGSSAMLPATRAGIFAALHALASITPAKPPTMKCPEVVYLSDWRERRAFAR